MLTWYIYAVVFGLLASIVELHSDEPQLPTLFLFVFASLFAFARPRHAWRLALLVWICVPLLHLVNAAFPLPGPKEFDGVARLVLSPLAAFFRCSWCQPGFSHVAGSVLALIPILLGTAAGLVVNRWQLVDKRA